MTFFGRWFITPSAVRSYAKWVGLDPNDDAQFREARGMLIDISNDAEFSLSEQDGMEFWVAEDGADKIVFSVSTKRRPEGDKPQVIGLHFMGEES